MRRVGMNVGAYLIASLLAIIGSPVAETLTVNRDKLEDFAVAFAKREEPVRILSFGDSMADSYRSVAFHLVGRMLEKRPFAGASFNNSLNASLFTSTNGATVAPPSSLWFSYQIKVPVGSSAHWNNGSNAKGTFADRLGLYWIAQPAGGLIEVSVSEKGGPWTPVVSLSGYSAAPQGCATNFSLEPSEYRVQVKSLTGTNYVLGPELVNQESKGLHAGWLDFGGITVGQVVAVPRAVREPILRAFAPDLLIWHFKEGEGVLAALPAALAENEDWFTVAAPDMDVIYVGTPYVQDSVGGAHTEEENRVVREFALSRGRAFVDCMSPGVSYDWLLNQGYMADSVHPNSAGGEYLAKAAWTDLGFFALGTDRELTVMRSERGMELGANLSPGLIYSFESSTNLVDWAAFYWQTNQTGAVQIRVPSLAGASHFRMRLLPME
jgi:hypothetical protein